MPSAMPIQQKSGKSPQCCSIPKDEIKILELRVDVDNGKEGLYRVRGGQRVYYIEIEDGIFDEDTMCIPRALIPLLPPLPDDNWTEMHISRSKADNSIQTTLSYEPLPSITETCHPARVDILSLPKLRSLKGNVYETEYEGQPAIVKIANFPWETYRVVNETLAYQFLRQEEEYLRKQQQNQTQTQTQPQQEAGSTTNPPAPSPEEEAYTSLIPKVLAHITENSHSRIIGLLLEKLPGTFAGPADLQACRGVVSRLHDIGLVHGDVNRYNFLIDRATGVVRTFDLEHAEPWEEEKARAELESLEAELSEETGRGGPPRRVVVGREGEGEGEEEEEEEDREGEE